MIDTELLLKQKRIHQLPVHLANQIAAGEVVERPASVLKELLENSLDAKSTDIEVTIQGGGLKLIQVQDNGLGICKEDLPLAIASHATSKIATLSDLEGVESYGFRGEALASIGSVSRLELISATEADVCGWSIQQEGRDKVPSLQPVAKRPGTLITVRDLFYNTPARRKFLKSEKTEMHYLEEVFKRVALSQPSVAFKFQEGEGSQKRLPICRSLEAHTRRVAQLCGKRFIEEAYYIEVESNGLKLTGWLGSEKALRSQADLQYFYVNGRIVRDKIVMHAVRQAYQAMNALGRFPAYVLYFTLDPAAVDVNVHPTKHEVRFREARTVHAFLSYAIQEGLKQDMPASATIATKTMTNKANFSFLESEKALYIHAIEEPVLEHEKSLSLFKNEFLWIENAAGVSILDVKAARRIYLQQTLTDAYHAEGISQRPLLMPKSIMVGNNSKNIESGVIDWGCLGFDVSLGGHDIVLVRAVPRVLGAKMEHLSALLLKLFALRTMEQCIAVLIDYVVTEVLLPMEEIEQLFIALKSSDQFKQKNSQSFYKQLTLEQFRAIFF